MPIIEINDEKLKLEYQNKFKNMLIIDIREPGEYAREHIEGSRNIPLSQLASTLFIEDKDQPVIFHCGIGMRTRNAASIIQTTGFKEIYCLEGGINQWKRCGLPTAINKKAPIEIIRQVQITAGSLVLLGLILGTTLNSYFLWLSAFIGAGLIFAGVTGWCGMAKLLSRLPWNRI